MSVPYPTYQEKVNLCKALTATTSQTVPDWWRCTYGMLNIPMPQIVLNQPRIRALVGQGKAAGMAQHVGMGFDGQACQPAIVADHQPGRLAAERAAPLADKESVGVRLHPGAVGQPCLDRPQLVTPERVRGGESIFEPL